MNQDLQFLMVQLERWRANPVGFVEKVLGAKPTSQQKELLMALASPGAHVSVKSGHGVGKSSTLAWAVLWFLACFPGDTKVPCTAPTGHQLKDILWAEVAKWHQNMHPWFKAQLEVKNDKVFIVGAEEIRFAVARTSRPETPEALQGFHAENILFIIDEASGIDEKVFEVAEGALSTPNARVVMAANPTQNTGYFYRSHHIDKDKWIRLHFSGLDSPLVSEKYVREMAEKYGVESDIYRVRVLGEFPAQGVCQLIPRPLAEAAMERKIKKADYQFAPVVIGVDVAWEGDDRSAIYRRQGLAAWRLWEGRHIDQITLGGIVDQFWKQEGADACFIDIGWGAGVIDFLRAIGRDPIAVNFGSRASNVRFANKRSEMWVLMKEWLESGGAIHGDKDLVEDIVGPEYFFQPNGKIMLEAKRDMKRRDLASPDLGDALALTFAAPVYKMSPMEELSGKASTLETDYDFLN